jgi:hypothetical protein
MRRNSAKFPEPSSLSLNPDDRQYESTRSSRTGSLDSEEAALINGRKTLAEVAARLNDLDGDGDEKRVVEGGRGLISVDRFPFLSSLFNFRSINHGIVVDEEDASQEDNPFADIFLWRFPLVSVVWFAILQVMFFLCVFCDYSLLTIGSFLLLWQLLVDFLMAKLVPHAQKLGLFSDDIDIKDVLRKNTFFNSRLNKRAASTTHELADMAIGIWRVTVFEANMSRVLVVTRFVIFVFFRSFSVATTLWLFLMILFTIPVSYSKNQVFAEAVADGAHVAASRRFTRVKKYSRDIVDTVAARAIFEAENINVGPESSRPLRMAVAAGWSVLFEVIVRVDWFLDKLFG